MTPISEAEMGVRGRSKELPRSRSGSGVEHIGVMCHPLSQHLEIKWQEKKCVNGPDEVAVS